MKRKKIPPAALAGMVVCGAAVVCKALQLAEAGTIWLLMRFGGYGWGAAAARAPLYVCIGLCTLLGVGASLWSLQEENRQYQRAARRQKIHQKPANTVKSKRKAG